MRPRLGARARFSRWCRPRRCHEPGAIERSKIYFREFHGHRTHRQHACALDAGFGADVLGHVEGFLKGFVQSGRRSGRVCSASRRLFSNWPRISVSPNTIESRPAANFEKMFEAVRFAERIEFIRQRIPVIHDVPTRKSRRAAKASRGSGA